MLDLHIRNTETFKRLETLRNTFSLFFNHSFLLSFIPFFFPSFLPPFLLSLFIVSL